MSVFVRAHTDIYTRLEPGQVKSEGRGRTKIDEERQGGTTKELVEPKGMQATERINLSELVSDGRG